MGHFSNHCARAQQFLIFSNKILILYQKLVNSVSAYKFGQYFIISSSRSYNKSNFIYLKTFRKITASCCLSFGKMFCRKHCFLKSGSISTCKLPIRFHDVKILNKILVRNSISSTNIYSQLQ